MPHSTTEPDDLVAKYRAERDKRLRADGREQYVEIAGKFSHYLDDPYVERRQREPLFDEVTVAFVGGGFAGLITGARLKQAGIDDVRIIEKGGDFGGTWYWNRYPGAQCDTSSFIYMPLLEETGHMPTEKYAHAPEILAHCRRIAEHFDLYDNACLSTEVTDIRWDEDVSRWIISTDRGDRMHAKYVAIGAGPLHRPKLPGIPGIESFSGHSFHTSRWDYDYTGGDPAGAAMTGLADKRVGIIGTGATAVQCVPHLARAARELFVFQRTPSSIDVRNNAPTDEDWFDQLEPGWQSEWLLNFATIQTGGAFEKDLVRDGWTDVAHRIRAKVIAKAADGFGPDTVREAWEESDDEKMTELRRRIDDIVADPATAEALKPWYRQFCKRPCFHDDYLDAYNEPAAHLIDTDGRGVERIDETGVWVDGTHYELDCLIYASGFEVGTSFTRRAGFDASGRDGTTLSEHWADGMRTLHGMHVHGFPNLFVVGPNQAANLTSNIPHNLVEGGATVAQVIRAAEDRGAATVEPTADAEQAWIEVLLGSKRKMSGGSDCTPGYYNNEGQSGGLRSKLDAAGYPAGAVEFFRHLDDWRSTGAFDGLVFADAHGEPLTHDPTKTTLQETPS